jgi:hypothetical protein
MTLCFSTHTEKWTSGVTEAARPEIVKSLVIVSLPLVRRPEDSPLSVVCILGLSLRNPRPEDNASCDFCSSNFHLLACP